MAWGYLTYISLLFFYCLPSGLAEESVIKDLVNRVNNLEKEGIQHRQLFQHQRADLQKLHRVIHQQNARLLYQNRVIQIYTKRIVSLERQLASLQNVKAEHSEMVKEGLRYNKGVSYEGPHQMSEIQPLSRSGYAIKDTESKKERIRQDRGVSAPVAFLAVFSSTGESHIGIDQIVVFPDVVNNLGNAYHSHLGVFIAPRNGVYLFSTSIRPVPGGYIDVDIVKNGKILVSLVASGSHASRNGQSSMTAVSQLAATDEVWVKLRYPPDSGLYGDDYSSFTGCLVTPL